VTAETILGLLALVFCLGFVLGDVARGRSERDSARRRIERVRWLYTGVKEW